MTLEQVQKILSKQKKYSLKCLKNGTYSIYHYNNRVFNVPSLDDEYLVRFLNRIQGIQQPLANDEYVVKIGKRAIKLKKNTPENALQKIKDRSKGLRVLINEEFGLSTILFKLADELYIAANTEDIDNISHRLSLLESALSDVHISPDIVTLMEVLNKTCNEIHKFLYIVRTGENDRS